MRLVYGAAAGFPCAAAEFLSFIYMFLYWRADINIYAMPQSHKCIISIEKRCSVAVKCLRTLVGSNDISMCFRKQLAIYAGNGGERITHGWYR